MSDPNPSFTTHNRPSLLEFQVETCGRSKTLEAINSLPDKALPVKELFLSIYNSDPTSIQPLYTQIQHSPDPEISDLITSSILLRALVHISFTRQDVAVVKELLNISPAPLPDMKSFINNCDGTRALYLGDCKNAEIWEIMLEYGYMHADEDNNNKAEIGCALESMLHRRDEAYLDAARVLLEHGAEVQIWHFNTVIKHHDIEFWNLLLGYVERETFFKDCRLLHEAIAFQRVEAVCWLIDVAGMNVDLVPTEGPRVFLEEFNLAGRAECNGTPLHEAVLGNDVWIVRLLLKRGANRRIRNEQGKTPFGVAWERGHWGVMACLVLGW